MTLKPLRVYGTFLMLFGKFCLKRLFIYHMVAMIFDRRESDTSCYEKKTSLISNKLHDKCNAHQTRNGDRFSYEEWEYQISNSRVHYI